MDGASASWDGDRTEGRHSHNCTRECLGLVADTSLSGRRVARELDAIILGRGRPDTIISDNGTECPNSSSNASRRWCSNAIAAEMDVHDKLVSVGRACIQAENRDGLSQVNIELQRNLVVMTPTNRQMDALSGLLNRWRTDRMGHPVADDDRRLRADGSCQANVRCKPKGRQMIV